MLVSSACRRLHHQARVGEHDTVAEHDAVGQHNSITKHDAVGTEHSAATHRVSVAFHKVISQYEVARPHPGVETLGVHRFNYTVSEQVPSAVTLLVLGEKVLSGNRGVVYDDPLCPGK